VTCARCGETEKTACIAGADIRSKLAHDAVPSTSAIGGLVLVAQLGAPISDVNDQYLVVWGLVALYGSIAVILEMFKRRSARAR
jgi:hypothetical protein